MSNKLDVLQKYMTKKVNTNKPVQNQIKVVDNDFEDLQADNYNSDEDISAYFVETEESAKLAADVKFNLLHSKEARTLPERKPLVNISSISLTTQKSGKWTTVTEVAKPQATASSKPNVFAKRKRSASPEDSDSDAPVRRRSDFVLRIIDRHDSDSEKEDEGPNKAAIKQEQEKMKDEMNKALGIKDNIGQKSLLDEARENNKEDDDSDDAEVVRKSEFVPTAGLTTATQFKLEREMNKDKDKRIADLAEQFKNTETIYRDKQGKRINIFKSIEDKKKELEQKNEQRIKEWSGGLAQKREAADKKKQLQNASEEFGKAEISREYEKELMQKKRFGDDMLQVLDKDEKKKDEKKFKFNLKCRFPGIPNRFGIEPGFMWDGCDRGNGYERKLAMKINTTKAQEENAQTYLMRDL